MRHVLSVIPRAVTILPAAVASLGVVTLATLTVLGTSAGANNGPFSAPSVPRTRTATTYYVSLGDSYSVGFQPSPRPGPTTGYSGAVARRTGMVLVNFGCSGATTTSILTTPGCSPPYGPQGEAGAMAYPHVSQASAAAAFIRQHRRHVGLITVSIGGNDFARCARADDPTLCVLEFVPQARRNVATLATKLRRAAGPSVPILGLTYPDVLLGTWVYPSSDPNAALATLSVTAFKSIFNPTLARAYRAGRVKFVDVTRATGAYIPLTATTSLDPYGEVPVAVARVCKLTWYCTQGNIHAKTSGYDLIAKEVVAAYRTTERVLTADRSSTR